MGIQSLWAFVTRLSVRERVIFYTTVLFVSLVLLDRLILTPILSKIDALRQEISAQEEAIEQSLIIVTQEDRIKGEADRYRSYLSDPQGEEVEVTGFLKEVENIAKKSSVYLIDVKPAGKDMAGVATRYFVKINFEAQMEQVFNFFYSVGHFEKLFKIESFEISPKTAGSSVVTCSVSISRSIVLK